MNNQPLLFVERKAKGGWLNNASLNLLKQLPFAFTPPGRQCDNMSSEIDALYNQQGNIRTVHSLQQMKKSLAPNGSNRWPSASISRASSPSSSARSALKSCTREPPATSTDAQPKDLETNDSSFSGPLAETGPRLGHVGRGLSLTGQSGDMPKDEQGDSLQNC